MAPLREVRRSPTKRAPANKDAWDYYTGVTMFAGSSDINDGEFNACESGTSVMVSKEVFDSGGERNVFHMRYLNGPLVGQAFVAKECKHDVSYQNDLEFHRKNITTQQVAQLYARQFSEDIMNKVADYEVEFMDCALCVIRIPGGKMRFLFIEPYMEGKFQKWNTNFGSVKCKSKKQDLYRIAESDSEADNDDDDDHDDAYTRCSIHDDDVPQAFTHYSRCHKLGNQELMICDLQGWFSTTRKTFVFIDPVIHSISSKKGKYGRTDRGQNGVEDFLRTHKCSNVCRGLGLPYNTKYQGFIDPINEMMMSSSSRQHTSDITVEKTNHLSRRQKERNITTRELQAAVKHGEKVPVVQTPGFSHHHAAAGRRTRNHYRHGDVNYITDAMGKIGITTYRNPSV
jgi:hypothetical protein